MGKRRLLDCRRRRDNGARRLDGRGRCVLRRLRRGLDRGCFGRLRRFGRGRCGFRGRSLRLNVDDHFPDRLGRPRRQRDDRERGDMERDHDGDDERPEPWRSERRRREGAPVQRRGGHGAGEFGAIGAGAFGARGAEAGGALRGGPETMAMRVTPFAASSSITDTTSP
jgi:hypothetical protein